MSKKNKKNVVDSSVAFDSKDVVMVTARVDDRCRGMFVCYADEQKINATPSGKMRQNDIRILPGDYVEIECSPTDTTRGRIVRRLNGSRWGIIMNQEQIEALIHIDKFVRMDSEVVDSDEYEEVEDLDYMDLWIKQVYGYP